MPAVLLHGVPETPAIWDDLRSHLSRDDVVALQLPGFGCDRPDGFRATKEEYVTWLAAELERVGADGPVDLVGHDWGGGFTVRLVSTRPELVRSWVTDAAGISHTDFEWHAFAKIWQTPGDGEEFFEQQLAIPAQERGPMSELDRTMADCILALYRSAVDVGNEWGPEFQDIQPPDLVIVAENDPFLDGDVARAAAANARAAVNEFPGVGHWWMTEAPERGAQILEEFWATLD